GRTPLPRGGEGPPGPAAPRERPRQARPGLRDRARAERRVPATLGADRRRGPAARLDRRDATDRHHASGGVAAPLRRGGEPVPVAVSVLRAAAPAARAPRA